MIYALIYLNGFEISRPHVFRSVDPKALDTKADQIIDEVSNLASDIILAPIKIIKTHQVTVADFSWVLVVANLAVGLVEVQSRKGNSWIVLSTSIEARAPSAGTRSVNIAQMFDTRDMSFYTILIGDNYLKYLYKYFGPNM